MQQTKFFCDVCGIEFPPQEYCFINGQVMKLDVEMKPQTFVFAGHYCGECTQIILKKVALLKEEKNAGHSKKKE